MRDDWRITLHGDSVLLHVVEGFVVATARNQPADDTGASRDVSRVRPRWSRRIAIATAVVFVVSSVFPITAGLSHDTASFPKWWGPADVVIAFGLGVLACAVLALGADRVDTATQAASYRAYRVVIHAVIALLVVFFLAGDRVVWGQCLTGLAWRYWLLLYCLPAWVAAMSGNVARSELAQS